MPDLMRNSTRSKRFPLGTVLCALSLPFAWLIPTVDAWGKEGHEIVANLAYDRLSKEARSEVVSILNTTASSLDDDDDPLNSSPLAHVANWADRVRYTTAYHWSTPLHFVDVRDDEIQGGCPCTSPESPEPSPCWFVYDRDCINDFCAVGAIANYTNRLISHREGGPMHTGNNLRASRPPKQTEAQNKWPAKEALMFATHFVGDIHQPLHSSRTSDRGGNSIHVRFHHELGSAHKAWNLHSVWDDGIIDRAISEMYNNSQLAFQQSVLNLVLGAEDSGLVDEWLRCSDGRNKQCPSSWAEESFEDALRWAYSDEHGQEIVDGAELSEEYFRTRLQVVRRRLAAAGVRLAAVLETALAAGRGVQDLKHQNEGSITASMVNALVVTSRLLQ